MVFMANDFHRPQDVLRGLLIQFLYNVPPPLKMSIGIIPDLR